MKKGYVHSLQSLGTVDGPGVRFVVFFQGCCLRCKCCHNPDTWELYKGKEYTPEEILSKVLRYRDYFGNDGGITLSGGEPLLQPEFARDIFLLCKENGINTCLDTSGVVLNEKVKVLLDVTDRVLLDFKYTNDGDYRKNVGCSIENVREFLCYLEQKGIPVTLRQVIIPTVNDSETNIMLLKNVIKQYSVIDKTELLPFRKICSAKYDNMGIDFPFGHIPEADGELINKLYSALETEP